MLCNRLQLAWAYAAHASEESQWERQERDAARQREGLQFEIHERVLLSDPDERKGKLAMRWRGPFRVTAALPNNNYALRDLKSRREHHVVHVSRMKRYTVTTDERPLDPDEWLVDELIGRRRGSDGHAWYKVKWRNYPRSEATWEPREALEDR